MCESESDLIAESRSSDCCHYLQANTFEEYSLHENHPPRFRCDRKRMVYEIAMTQSPPSKAVKIEAIRWKTQDIPECFPPAPERRPQFRIVSGVFDYTRSAPDDAHWYLNFADPQLFVAYGTPLLAQDELQVAEHPALACLREALIAGDMSTSVEDDEGRPTPFTIQGVPRRVEIDTTTGVYGNAFSHSGVDAIREAVKQVKPIVRTNILAITAPPSGDGVYKQEEIEAALLAAYTGFSAARAHVPSARTTIHTGFWGCGAFGGNRTLMTIVQAVAAETAGVDIIFHAFDKSGVTVARDAYAQFEEVRSTISTPRDAITALHALRYTWGESDGN